MHWKQETNGASREHYGLRTIVPNVLQRFRSVSCSEKQRARSQSEREKAIEEARHKHKHIRMRRRKRDVCKESISGSMLQTTSAE